MALLVVEIHVKPLSVFGSETLNAVTSAVDCVAVPFFFIASAFLCFRGMNPAAFRDPSSREAARVRSTAKKLLFLYATWFALYLPFDIWESALEGGSPTRFTTLELRGFLLIGEGAASWPLWYLLASAVGFMLVYVLLRGGWKPVVVLAASSGVLLLGFGMAELHGIDNIPATTATLLDVYFKAFGTVRNGLFEGFFYTALGACLGIRWRRAASVSIAAPVLLASAGFAGCVLVSPDAHLPFCTAYALGVFLLSIRKNGDEDIPSHPWARNASTTIYLVHMMAVIVLFQGVFRQAEPYTIASGAVDPALLYPCTLALSGAVAAIAIATSRRHSAVRRVFGF